ncbi:unnamed protein product [Rotaria sordida]|uniref:SH3b domain-containing protein n=1 Tax=Rotaria sordida TaxID=392033 RepID=A0A815D4F6_9BILA|nr:unnamed protein product [Rotaria sordida]CAF1565363.1 unnamed protein product [Rotaria sordida]
MATYAKAGTVYCSGGANVRSCSSTSCSIVSYVVAGNSYPSDCYVIGSSVTIGGSTKATWYRLNLKAGGKGYVSAHYCSGNVGKC